MSKKVKKAEGLIEKDISVEKWREYEWKYVLEGEERTRIYRIENPKLLVLHKSSTTHRVTDAKGITHCVPAPHHDGCVVRWKGPVIF